MGDDRRGSGGVNDIRMSLYCSLHALAEQAPIGYIASKDWAFPGRRWGFGCPRPFRLWENLKIANRGPHCINRTVRLIGT